MVGIICGDNQGYNARYFEVMSLQNADFSNHFYPEFLDKTADPFFIQDTPSRDAHEDDCILVYIT